MVLSVRDRFDLARPVVWASSVSDGGCLLPDDLDAVGGELGVGGENGKVLFQRLRDDHAIEWVAMVRRQDLGAKNVRAENGKQ